MNQEPFVLEVHEPYSTFVGGKPVAIPYVIAGLAPQGALSALGGKAKHGKSSMSRCEAVCISKGIPFLGRAVQQGEVLLCSLEDPQQHIDNCLQVLEYNKRRDARIHVVTKLPRNVTETVNILVDFLTGHPDVRFVVLDTLAKVVRAKDVNDYNEMLTLCEQLHLLARHFSKLHVQVLTHCKKVATDDPFDGFLGSVEIRAETDTNIVIFDKQGRRVIQSETRMGSPWDATVLNAEMGDLDGTAMVKKFSLGSALTEDVKQKAEHHVSIDARLIEFLKERNGSASAAEYREIVQGNNQAKTDALDRLVKAGTVYFSGVPRSPTNPLQIHLVDVTKDVTEVSCRPN